MQNVVTFGGKYFPFKFLEREELNNKKPLERVIGDETLIN